MQQGTTTQPPHPDQQPDPQPDQHPSTLTTTLLSATIFFFLLYGYFLLRPLREAMGVQRSMSDLRELFLITCAASLVISLAFGSLVSRANPRRFITIGYRTVIACLLVFALALLTLPEDLKLYSGYVFYVWLSIVNLFMVSVFWGFMADTWSLEQAKKLYPTIGVGGTLGAILGSYTAWTTADLIGPIWQMLAACLCFELAIQTMRRVKQTTAHHQHPHQQHAQHEPIGGAWHQGATTLLRSPYLLGIGLYITLVAISSTLIYFTQAKIVTEGADELAQRIALFAQLDLYAQLATLLVQLFVTAKLIKHLGIAFALCIIPVITLLGFIALAWVSDQPNIEPWQVFAVLAIFSATHRATRYAIIRPARETLFSVVSRHEKYKSKPIIDVFLYRGGDVAGTGIESTLAGAAVGLWGMVMVAAPLAALWSGLAIALAIMQHKRSQSVSQDTKEPQEIPS
ncbi:MAG: NTP/NDP exchange transporter [Phycisphaerales bacterium]